MRIALMIWCLLLATPGMAQVTVDVTKTTVIAREKTPAGPKTLSIYTVAIPGKEAEHTLMYQPTAAEFGEEGEGVLLNFTAEAPHIKTLIDAALKKKPLNMRRFCINLLVYNDLLGRLADLYINSKEWNDYLRKATNLKQTTTLYDGSIATEIVYDTKVANAVLEKSDLLKEINALFAPYGYKAGFAGFPDDHSALLPEQRLLKLGKGKDLLVPMPNNFFILTRVK